MTSVHCWGRKTPSAVGQDSQSKDYCLSRKCKIRISSQWSPPMYLYTNACFPGFYLYCCQRHWRTSLFLLHWEPVFPSWISLNVASRSHYSFYNPKNTSLQLAQLDQALNSLFALAISFTFETHSITKPPPATDALPFPYRCYLYEVPMSQWSQAAYHTSTGKT